MNCTGRTFAGTLIAGGFLTVEALFTGCTVLESKFCKVYEGLKVDNDPSRSLAREASKPLAPAKFYYTKENVIPYSKL